MDALTGGLTGIIFGIFMPLIELSSKNFDKEVLQSKLPILVEFYTTWCTPCKAMKPILEQLSHEFHGRLRFGRLDIEHSPEFAVKYGVMSVPMMMVFHKGKVIGGRAGATDKEILKRELNSILRKIESGIREDGKKEDSIL